MERKELKESCWKDLWEEVNLPEFEKREDLLREIFQKIDRIGDSIYDVYRSEISEIQMRCNEALEMLRELEALVRQLNNF